MAHSTNTSGGTEVPLVPTTRWIRSKGLRRAIASYLVHGGAIVAIVFKPAVRTTSVIEAAETVTARQKPGTLQTTPLNKSGTEENTTTRTRQLEAPAASVRCGSLTTTTAVIAGTNS